MLLLMVSCTWLQWGPFTKPWTRSKRPSLWKKKRSRSPYRSLASYLSQRCLLHCPLVQPLVLCQRRDVSPSRAVSGGFWDPGLSKAKQPFLDVDKVDGEYYGAVSSYLVASVVAVAADTYTMLKLMTEVF